MSLLLNIPLGGFIILLQPTLHCTAQSPGLHLCILLLASGAFLVTQVQRELYLGAGTDSGTDWDIGTNLEIEMELYPADTQLSQTAGCPPWPRILYFIC